MDCGHGWHNKNDCEICRPSAIVVARLRGRIAEIEAALRKINALIDSPARFNPEVQAVLDSVIDTSDIKFATVQRQRG